MEFRIRKNTPVHPHDKHWQFCVGSGHAVLALRTDYTRQLKFIHDTLGIERVRFHGIFCDDMRTFNDLSMMYPIPGSEAFEEYNFNACGVAYDNVLDAGMKPFVELSFMPGKLARKKEGEKPEGSFFYKPLIVPPEDLEAWKKYITAFLDFLIHRYGSEEIRTWFFEVWNEPDLPVAFWNGTRDEYFQLYEATAQAIKAKDPQIRVGGPATSNSKWVRSFLKYCRERNVPVDFVSTHQYAGDPLGGVESQGTNPKPRTSNTAYFPPMPGKSGSRRGDFRFTTRNGTRTRDFPPIRMTPARRRPMTSAPRWRRKALWTAPPSGASAIFSKNCIPSPRNSTGDSA